MCPGCFSCSPLSLRQIKHGSWLKSLQASRWAGGPKVQARGLISKSRRPGRVQSTPLSHTILEMTKFVCAAIPAEIILLFRKIQNTITKQIDFKLSTRIVSVVNRRLLVEENFLKFLKFFSSQSCSTMGVEGVSVKLLARPLPHIPRCHQGHNQPSPVSSHLIGCVDWITSG